MCDGAILFDAALPLPGDAQWFEPDWWRQRKGLVGTAGGRGQAYFLHGPHGEWVLRPYRRGGMVRHLSTASYLWLEEARTRPFAEWRLLAYLYGLGLPVPRPVAACYRRRSRFLYTGALITARLPARETLRDLVIENRAHDALWHDIGAAIRRLHEAGVSHADLNAANILIGAGGRVWFVDFDQGRMPRRGAWRDRNLARLLRSLHKAVAQAGRRSELEAQHWRRLLQGYRDPV